MKIALIFFSFLVLPEISISFKILFPRITRRHKFPSGSRNNEYDPRPGEDGYTESYDQPKYVPGNYYPKAGLENLVYNFGDYKSMTPTDYDLAFKLYPNLRMAVQKRIWPSMRSIPDFESEWIVRAIQRSEAGSIPLLSHDSSSSNATYYEQLMRIVKHRTNQIDICCSSDLSWRPLHQSLEKQDLHLVKLLRPLSPEEPDNNSTSSPGDQNNSSTSELYLDLGLLWERTLSKLLNISVEVTVHPSGYHIYQFTDFFEHRDTLFIKNLLQNIFRLVMKIAFSFKNIRTVYVGFPSTKWLFSKIVVSKNSFSFLKYFFSPC
jgi:hypothetical protein